MHDELSFGPIEIWQSMGVIGQSVFLFLVLMSVYSIAVMVDRVLFFRRARRQSLLFVNAARKRLIETDLEGTLGDARSHPQSHVARIYTAAINDYSSYDSPPPGFEDTVRRAVEREVVLVAQDFKRGLAALASIGATAPFVGLFGTVIGIMNAFFGMARTGQGGIGAVSGGIAEALVNTAVGLFVALPAVWAFNYFTSRIEHFLVEMNNSGSELVDYFIKRQRG